MKPPRLLLLFVPALLATAQPDTRGELPDRLVELPPFVVAGKIELPKPESWLYTRIDGFEVLSNAPQRETNRLLKDFQRFRQALQIVRPEAKPPDAPATLILCGREGAYGQFLPENDKKFEAILSLLLHDRERTAIVANLERAVLQVDDVSVTRLSGQSGRMPGDDSHYEGLEVEPHRQLYRQYARLLLTQGEGRLPPWLLEGVTQIIMDMDFHDRSIRFGWLDATKGAPLTPFLSPYGELDVSAGPTAGAGGAGTMSAGDMIGTLSGGFKVSGEPDGLVGDRPFPLVLARAQLLPLDQFFAVSAASPSARNPLGNTLWAKQAYAFVHMCQFRADGKFKEPFDRFVRRLAVEPLNEALFRECFGLGYEEMLKELYAYIRYPRHQFRNVKLTEEGRLTAPEVTFREATQGEIARIKGDAQRLAGRRAEALFTYRVGYARGERDPALLAALGVAELHDGQTDRARKFLETAAKLDTDRPSAWTALARLRLNEARAKPAEAGKLSATQMAAVLAPLLKGRTLQPALPETYRIMAEAWELSATSPAPANVHVIGEGVMKFPFDSSLALLTAQLYARAGDVRSAAEVARRGLRFTQDATARARFNQFLGTLPPPPSPGALPGGAEAGSSHP
jgi:tetratricopeptide (TPR) repeat protein